MESVIGFLLFWIALWLLWVMLRLVGRGMTAARAMGEPIRLSISQIGSAIGRPAGLLSEMRIVTWDTTIVTMLLAFALSFVDRALVVQFTDQIGRGVSPFVGWALGGFTAGCVLSALAVSAETGLFKSAPASNRVPDIEHLKDGNRTARSIRKVKVIVAVLALITLAIMVGMSWSSNSRYSEVATVEEKLTTVHEAATRKDIALLNRALNDAVSGIEQNPLPRQGTDHVGPLKLLNALKVSAANEATTALGRIGQTASRYLLWYRSSTEKLVNEGTLGAFARSESFREIDEALALMWLGRLYERGAGGAPQDLVTAFLDYQEAGRLGRSEAIQALEALAEKMATASDEAARQMAFGYFLPKANQGDARGQYWLGQWFVHAAGNGVGAANAQKWFLDAASQDADPSVRALAFIALVPITRGNAAVVRLLDELAPTFAVGKSLVASAAAYDYLEQRAVDGDPGAQLWTGYRYREGYAAPKDYKRARQWFLSASLQEKNDAAKERAVAALADLQEREK